MRVIGTITTVLPETSGVSKTGRSWRKQEAIVEYIPGQWPKSIVFQILGDKIDQLNIQQGVEYELELDFNTNEWQGRYFLQASCWKATPTAQPQAATPQQPPQQQYSQPAPTPAPTPPISQIDDDGLPF